MSKMLSHLTGRVPSGGADGGGSGCGGDGGGGDGGGGTGKGVSVKHVISCTTHERGNAPIMIARPLVSIRWSAEEGTAA